MKAWLLDRIGSLSDLRKGDTPDPTPAAGEALLRVELAAINPADRYLAEGQYPAKPSFPHILGRDGVGVVEAVGAGAGGVKAADRRIILRSEIGVNRRGTLAERVAVPVESLAPVPAGWSAEESAGAALVYLTAYQALTMWGEVAPGVLLVTGASGGVGVACVHLGRAMGFEIIALSRSEEKSRKLVTEGANHAVDPGDAVWPKKVKEILGKRRVDLAVDNIGGAGFNQILETLGERGRVSCVGRLAGPVPELNTASLFFRRIRIGGVNVGAFSAAEAQSAWGRIVEMLAKSGARPIVDSVWEFGQLREAFERLAKGPMGKVLVKASG